MRLLERRPTRRLPSGDTRLPGYHGQDLSENLHPGIDVATADVTAPEGFSPVAARLLSGMVHDTDSNAWNRHLRPNDLDNPAPSTPNHALKRGGIHSWLALSSLGAPESPNHSTITVPLSSTSLQGAPGEGECYSIEGTPRRTSSKRGNGAVVVSSGSPPSPPSTLSPTASTHGADESSFTPHLEEPNNRQAHPNADESFQEELLSRRFAALRAEVDHMFAELTSSQDNASAAAASQEAAEAPQRSQLSQLLPGHARMKNVVVSRRKEPCSSPPARVIRQQRASAVKRRPPFSSSPSSPSATVNTKGNAPRVKLHTNPLQEPQGKDLREQKPPSINMDFPQLVDTRSPVPMTEAERRFFEAFGRSPHCPQFQLAERIRMSRRGEPNAPPLSSSAAPQNASSPQVLMMIETDCKVLRGHRAPPTPQRSHHTPTISSQQVPTVTADAVSTWDFEWVPVPAKTQPLTAVRSRVAIGAAVLTHELASPSATVPRHSLREGPRQAASANHSDHGSSRTSEVSSARRAHATISEPPSRTPTPSADSSQQPQLVLSTATHHSETATADDDASNVVFDEGATLERESSTSSDVSSISFDCISEPSPSPQ